jgi:hypothetical protein
MGGAFDSRLHMKLIDYHQLQLIDLSSTIYRSLATGDYIDPNTISNQDNTFSRDEMDAANQMFRQTIVHQMRKKALSINERQKKRDRTQMSKATNQFRFGPNGNALNQFRCPHTLR